MGLITLVYSECLIFWKEGKEGETEGKKERGREQMEKYKAKGS